MIKLVAFLAFFYSIFAGLASLHYASDGFALSVLLGGAAILVNIAGLSYSWRLIFLKKSIALAVLVIIFKYLLLGLVLWSLAEVKWLSPLGFCLGLGSLVFAVLSALFIKAIFKEKI